MSGNFEILKHSPLFKDVSYVCLADIENVCKVREFKDGDTIINDGEHGDTLYLLKSGTVSVIKKLTMLEDKIADMRDKELILLKAERNDFFGEMVLCSDIDIRSATVRATSECEVIEIKAHDIHMILKHRPECAGVFYKNLSALLAQRLRKSNNDILKLTTALTLALEDY